MFGREWLCVSRSSWFLERRRDGKGLCGFIEREIENGDGFFFSF